MHLDSSVPPILTIDSIEPKLKTTLKVPNIFHSELCECQMLRDGKLLILDRGRKILLLFLKMLNALMANHLKFVSSKAI